MLHLTDDHMARRISTRLHSGNKWRRLKIFFDEEDTFTPEPQWKDFYKKVWEIVGNFWGEAVWINDNHQAYIDKVNDTIKNESEKWGDALPNMHGYDFKNYDLLIKCGWDPDNFDGTLAVAQPIVRHPESHRPIMGVAAIMQGGHNMFMSNRDPLNLAAETLIHEFGHVIAFIAFKEMHPHYVVHQAEKDRWMWTGKFSMLTAKVFYGCPASEMKG
jgi:hypothetical protein